MKIAYASYALAFRHPFGISHSSRTHTPVVYLRLGHDGHFGYGEAALPPYLGETQESVIAFFNSAAPLLAGTPQEALSQLSTAGALAPGNAAATAAIDIALHDLLAKTRNLPVWQSLGIEEPLPKETSVTIGIGDLSLIENKVKELEDFSLIKVKLGHSNDREIITAIRQYTPKPLAVDVNQGWQTKEHALDMIAWLNEMNVVYVEQPLAKENLADMRWLTERSPLPLLADESFQRLAELERIAGCFSGINLKLMKCGGLAEGKLILEKARALGLKVNIGCMSESSCGIAAAAQLMRGADWIDLDGPLLIGNDPFGGVGFEKGRLHLSSGSGLGVTPKTSALQFVTQRF